ncbi:hypothetical protein B0H12DRAFT_1070060 [Mycena haematopus]|nr:hypothetical protein B0H12DRAFT_1070060 [Mycena haematopus]
MHSPRTPRRPRSPVSMYGAYETAVTKTPKPLIKLEKKRKGSQQMAVVDHPEKAPTRTASPAVVSNTAPHQRALVPFLSLRRKNKQEPSPPRTTPALPRGCTEKAPVTPAVDTWEQYTERLYRAPVAPAVDIDEVAARPCDDFVRRSSISELSAPSSTSSETAVHEEPHPSFDDCYTDTRTKSVSSFLSTMEFEAPSELAASLWSDAGGERSNFRGAEVGDF